MLTDQLHLQQQQHEALGLQDHQPDNIGAVIDGPVVDRIATNRGGGRHHGGSQAPAAVLGIGETAANLPSMQTVCDLARTWKYGVVLSEQQLLGSLLASYGTPQDEELCMCDAAHSTELD